MIDRVVRGVAVALGGSGGSATFDATGTYRYNLYRVWAPNLDVLVFVMLNPSTADADQDDPTVRRCIGFAKRDGFGGLVVVNLFALRATNPDELYGHPDPVGPKNDHYLLDAATNPGVAGVVAAWGVHGNLHDRAGKVLELLGDLPIYRLGPVTRGGHPRHPLFLRGDVPLEGHRVGAS